MSDQEIIEAAFADSVKTIYATFYLTSYSARNAQEKKAAETTFVRGVEIARGVRDRAKELIQPANPPG